MNCDCHIHIILDGVFHKDAIARHTPVLRGDLVRATLRRYADAGVTYLRDGGDSCGAALFAKKIAPEYGIDFAAPAFPIHRKGRYGDFIGRGYGTGREYLALLDEARRQGADFIKLMLSGIMDFKEYGRLSCPPLDFDEMCALIGHAHRYGFAVMAHVNGDEAVRSAILAGADSIEHGYYMSSDTLKLLTEHAAVWVPTLSPILNIADSGWFSGPVLRRIGEEQLAAVSRGARLGALIASGSDGGACGVPHPDCARDELCYLQSALGADTRSVLGRGLARIRERFGPRGGENATAAVNCPYSASGAP